MDKIDTLVISGGGPSGIAYLGVFKGLFEKKIISTARLTLSVSTQKEMI